MKISPKYDPDFLCPFDFILAIEQGTITEDQFAASAQSFVDSGVWTQLQGSWQRHVRLWAEQGLVTIAGQNLSKTQP